MVLKPVRVPARLVYSLDEPVTILLLLDREVVDLSSLETYYLAVPVIGHRHRIYPVISLELGKILRLLPISTGYRARVENKLINILIDKMFERERINWVLERLAAFLGGV